MTAAPLHLEAERRAAFARELDALHKKYQAMVGAEDAAYVENVDRFSKRMTLLGRALIHVSLEPVTFTAGVAALWVGKQLAITELGHVVMHGTYDKVPGAEKFSSETYDVDMPVDPVGWKYNHNVLHHSYPNVVGKDPDARFGMSRLNASVKHRWYHRFQLLEVAFNWLNMANNLNAQVTGLVDFYLHDRGDEDVLRDRKPATVVQAHAAYLKKAVPYAVKNFVLWPALAGPFFPKVLLGNLLAEGMRNVFTAVAIYCGHVGEELADFTEDEKPANKADWYLLQLAATSNFEVPLWVSQLLGALDRQVEHHLFPRLPPNRLRAMAPELRALCAEYGVPYHTGPWPSVIAGMVGRIAKLGRNAP